MFRKILVGYDGSEHAKKALNVAIDLAKQVGSELHIITVIDIFSINSLIDAPIPKEVIENLTNRAHVVNKEAVEISSSKGVAKVKSVVIQGDPASMIVKYAAENGIDLIVIGSRGLSTFKRILLGSVSISVVRDSKVPILIVK